MHLDRCYLALYCSLILAFALEAKVLAQSSLGGGDSAFGQSTGGLSGGFGQSAFGQSSFGQSGFGQGGFGQTGAGGDSGPSLISGETGFIGRDAADIQAFYEAVGRQIQQAAAGGGRSGRQRSDINTDDVGRPPVRVKLTMSNSLRPSGSQAIQCELESLTRISHLLSERNLSGVEIQSTSGIVQLTGVVSSQDERRLAEAIASIEPGVRSVDNQLQVVQSEAVPTPAAE